MKKFLGALLVCIMATPALAGMNIRQNADGTTDWVNSKSNAQNVGAVYLTVDITDVSTAVTAVLTSPITDAKVTYIQVIKQGEFNDGSSDAVLDMYIAAATSPSESTIGAASTELTNATGRLTMTVGQMTGHVVTFTPTGVNHIEQGGVLYIHSNGGSSGATRATVVVTIEPNG